MTDLQILELREKLPAFCGTQTFIMFTSARNFCPSHSTIHALSPCHLKIHFYIILSSTSRSSKFPPRFRFPHQRHVRISLFPHKCHLPHPAQFPPFDLHVNIRHRLENTKLSHYAIYSASMHFFPLGPNSSVSALFRTYHSIQNVTTKSTLQQTIMILCRKSYGTGIKCPKPTFVFNTNKQHHPTTAY